MSEIISRAQAKASGLRHYFTGKPCRNGHVAQRLVSCNDCVECSQSRLGSWYGANKSRQIGNVTRWRVDNPGADSAYQSRRRAKQAAARPTWFGELDSFVEREAYSLCADRERATGIAWQVDHMIPLLSRKACGLHCAANLQVIPACLNAKKGNRMQLTEPDEWLSQI